MIRGQICGKEPAAIRTMRMAAGSFVSLDEKGGLGAINVYP